MHTSLSELCVYTIRHSDDLIDGRSATFHEGRAWATGKRLLEESERRNERLAVIFSSAEHTDELIAWALLDKIEITPEGTDYTFSNLSLIKKRRPSKTALKKRNGEPLDQNFIRPYAICRTPSFLCAKKTHSEPLLLP